MSINPEVGPGEQPLPLTVPPERDPRVSLAVVISDADLLNGRTEASVATAEEIKDVSLLCDAVFTLGDGSTLTDRMNRASELFLGITDVPIGESGVQTCRDGVRDISADVERLELLQRLLVSSVGDVSRGTFGSGRSGRTKSLLADMQQSGFGGEIPYRKGVLGRLKPVGVVDFESALSAVYNHGIDHVKLPDRIMAVRLKLENLKGFFMEVYAMDSAWALVTLPTVAQKPKQELARSLSRLREWSEREAVLPPKELLEQRDAHLEDMRRLIKEIAPRVSPKMLEDELFGELERYLDESREERIMPLYHEGESLLWKGRNCGRQDTADNPGREPVTPASSPKSVRDKAQEAAARLALEAEDDKRRQARLAARRLPLGVDRGGVESQQLLDSFAAANSAYEAFVAAWRISRKQLPTQIARDNKSLWYQLRADNDNSLAKEDALAVSQAFFALLQLSRDKKLDQAERDQALVDFRSRESELDASRTALWTQIRTNRPVLSRSVSADISWLTVNWRLFRPKALKSQVATSDELDIAGALLGVEPDVVQLPEALPDTEPHVEEVEAPAALIPDPQDAASQPTPPIVVEDIRRAATAETNALAEQLDWIVFPPGERVTKDELVAIARETLGNNSGLIIDEQRMEDLLFFREIFGGELYRSSERSLGDRNNLYYVLKFKYEGCVYALAENPVYGNATYIIREDQMPLAPGETVLSAVKLPRKDVRDLGALRIIHTDNLNLPHADKVFSGVFELLRLKPLS